MNWLIPTVWIANFALLSFFVLKLRRDFELSGKHKAFEEEEKERRKQVKKARIQEQQQQHEASLHALNESDSTDALQPNDPATENEPDKPSQTLIAPKEILV